MLKHLDSGQPRVRGLAVLTAVATLVSALALSLGVASADTSGTPDTNTKAAYNPTVASTGGVNPGATLAGAAQGSRVNIHVDGQTGKFFGASARLCKPGLSVVTASQLSPSQFGNCIPAPFDGSGSNPDNDFASGTQDATNTFTDFFFKVGTGSQTFTANNGDSTITCDASNPCDLWIDESVSTTVASSGHVFKHYTITYAGAPGAPGIAVVAGNQQLTVNVTAPASAGGAPLGNYSVTVTGPGGGTQTGAGTSYTFTGLTNFTSYSVSATVENNTAGGGTPAHYTSAAATDSGTPVPPAAGTPSGVPGNGKVDLTWSAPSGAAPSSYEAVATPTNPAGADISHTGISASCPGGTCSHSFTGLTNGTVYTFKVRGIYGGTPGAFSASSAPITPNSTLITQTISARRPQGALVLTQVCGAHGATTTGTAPQYNGGDDPLFPQYPYPEDSAGEPVANYPTACGVSLGTARLIKSGAGAGQFFTASGLLNQVTIVDTRDDDPGFTVNGQMGDFTATAGSFSGSQLGWTPVKTADTDGFDDASTPPNHYDQTVSAGSAILPNTANGLGAGSVLGSATAGSGLGIGVLDANLTLWIPIFAKTGDYTGVLSLTAV